MTTTQLRGCPMLTLLCILATITSCGKICRGPQYVPNSFHAATIVCLCSGGQAYENSIECAENGESK